MTKWVDTMSNDCEKALDYFKMTSDKSCIFKTADGVWWDIKDIENPVIMLKDYYKDENTHEQLKQLAKESTNTNVFAMTAKIYYSSGLIRVNDKAYEDSLENNQDNKDYLEKLYSFINYKKSS